MNLLLRKYNKIRGGKEYDYRQTYHHTKKNLRVVLLLQKNIKKV